MESIPREKNTLEHVKSPESCTWRKLRFQSVGWRLGENIWVELRNHSWCYSTNQVVSWLVVIKLLLFFYYHLQWAFCQHRGTGKFGQKLKQKKLYLQQQHLTCIDGESSYSSVFGTEFDLRAHKRAQLQWRWSSFTPNQARWTCNFRLAQSLPNSTTPCFQQSPRWLHVRFSVVVYPISVTSV